MKNILIILVLFTTIFAQNQPAPKKTPLPTTVLKCGTLEKEEVINQYFAIIRYYEQQKKESKFTPEQLEQLAQRLYKNFLYVPGLNYRTVAEKASIYLLETVADKLVVEKEKVKKEDTPEKEPKKNKRTLVKELNSVTEINAIQLKQQEGAVLKKQIANLAKDSTKVKELEEANLKLKRYQDEMYKSYGVRSELTYQISTTKLSIYLIVDYSTLKKLSEFQNNK